MISQSPQLGDIVSAKEIGKARYARYIWYQCPQCKQYRWLRTSCLKQPRFTGLCKKCHCKNQLPPEALNKGPTHGSWRGGRYHRSQGDYIIIWLPPDDFFFPMVVQKTGYGGYVYEHRLIMAKHLKRCLLPWEVIHHKNGIKDDNRLENLIMYKGQARHVATTRLEREIKRQQKIIERLQDRILQLEADLIIIRKGERDGQSSRSA
jgi:hypothetical protein